MLQLRDWNHARIRGNDACTPPTTYKVTIFEMGLVHNHPFSAAQDGQRFNRDNCVTTYVDEAPADSRYRSRSLAERRQPLTGTSTPPAEGTIPARISMLWMIPSTSALVYGRTALFTSA